MPEKYIAVGAGSTEISKPVGCGVQRVQAASGPWDGGPGMSGAVTGPWGRLAVEGADNGAPTTVHAPAAPAGGTRGSLRCWTGVGLGMKISRGNIDESLIYRDRYPYGLI